jgi:iron complex outermembrane receptor protein
MMEKALSRSIRLMCLGSVAFGMHAAYAQDASQNAAPLQRVEVTGSRIRQVDLETAQPVQVMTQEQIQKTGLVTVGDILNNLSSAGTPDFSKGGSLVSNRENGGQYISLRNLGANRLLVLVDGKRWSQSINGYTDLSTIPAALIDRIEVLKDGASSIYGSDAIAGVVNIILKKSMDGGQLSVYEGANQHGGDGKSKDFSLTYGANSDKGSLVFGLSHTEQGTVWARDRDITAYTYGPNHISDSLGTSPWGRIAPLTAAGGPNTKASTGGFNQILNHTGSYDGMGVGQASNVATNYHAYAGADADLFDSSQQMMFEMPTKLDSIFTKGTLELPYGMHFTSTAMFAQRNSSATAAGYPMNSLSQPTYPVYIDKNSYYNPYPGQDLFFYRRTIELPRTTDNQNRTLHIDATLAGEFNALGRTFNWDVGYNHSDVSGSTLSNGNLNLINLKKALGPSFYNPATQQVQCGTAANPIAPNQCTPFNILGGPSASNAAALAYVNETGQATYGSTVNSATANIAGSLYDLPAGELGFAAGIENRSLRGYDYPGQMEQAGYSTDLGANPTNGHYNVKEEYAELAIPVLKDQPFAKLLSFDLATRHSDYSNFGTANNSKVSFMWKPMGDLLVRGTWAQGFRAPTVGDTFGGGQQTYDNYLDPCDSRYGEAASNPVVAQRCAAAGVPAGFRQLNSAGVAVGGTGGQGAYPFYSGAGNTTLTPERAVTDTLGFVYSPSYLPGFSASVDWFRIKVNNMITAVGATWVAQQCYVENNPTFCSAIQRNPAGEISSLSRGNLNLGEMQTDGADISFGYRFPMTQYGRFALRSDTSYVHSFKQKSTSDAEWQDYAGDYFYNKWKSTNAVDWSMGNWSATWTARFYSAVRDQCWDVESAIECSNPTGYTESFGTGYNKLGAEVYHDLNVGYKTSWKGQIQFGINNLFDKKPRISYTANTSGQASSSSVDPNLPLDRFFYVRYNQSF